MGLGGNNGMTDFKDILGFSVQSDTTRASLCFASALALAIFLVISGAVVSSRFGKALTAVRDAESRMRFLGYRVEGYKLFVFVLSAAMAGVAGALYVPQVGIINPSEFSPGNSIEAVLWVAVGGRGTLIGPVIGAFLVNCGQDLSDGRAARSLAVRAGRAVHCRHAVPAQGRGRPVVADPQPWHRAQGEGARD